MQEDTLKIKRPAFGYYGGKWRIGPWIVNQFPPHARYAEPFAGAASVLIRKRAVAIEALGDVNDDVLNFLITLRDQPDWLVRAIDMTPYSREEIHIASDHSAQTDPVERARRFYIRCEQEYGFGGDMRGRCKGWRFNVARNDRDSTAAKSWSNTEHLHLIARRLKNVIIEHSSAFDTIPRYDTPETLFYVDPPYVLSTRVTASVYTNELTDADHIKLAELIHNSKGMFIVNGYPSDLYRELYAGFHFISRQARDAVNNIQTECLWVSPNAMLPDRTPLLI